MPRRYAVKLDTACPPRARASVLETPAQLLLTHTVCVRVCVCVCVCVCVPVCCARVLCPCVVPYRRLSPRLWCTPSQPGLQVRPEGSSTWQPIDKEMREDEAVLFCGMTLARLTGMQALYHRILTNGHIRYSAPVSAAWGRAGAGWGRVGGGASEKRADAGVDSKSPRTR